MREPVESQPGALAPLPPITGAIALERVTYRPEDNAPAILRAADKIIEIPMLGKKESLNVAVAFGVVVRGFGCSIQLFNGAQCFTPILVGKFHLFGTVYSDTLMGAVFLGFPCHHYFVDQFIWKPSRDKDLRRDLKLDPATAPAAG